MLCAKSGIVWETILAEFVALKGDTVLASIAFHRAFLTKVYPATLNRHLVHHEDDKLCVWRPTPLEAATVERRGFQATLAPEAKWLPVLAVCRSQDDSPWFTFSSSHRACVDDAPGRQTPSAARLPESFGPSKQNLQIYRYKNLTDDLNWDDVNFPTSNLDRNF